MNWIRSIARVWNRETSKSNKPDAFDGHAEHEFRIYKCRGGWVVQMEIHDNKTWDSKYERVFVPETEGDQIGSVITGMLATAQLTRAKK
jgi:hypothetical protein